MIRYLSCLFLILFSSLSYAQYYEITYNYNKIPACSAPAGSIITETYFSCPEGKLGSTGKNVSSVASTGSLIRIYWDDGKYSTFISFTSATECPVGQELNSEGVCEEPDPYCDTPAAQSQMQSDSAACEAKGWNFTASCPAGTGNYSSSCTEPETDDNGDNNGGDNGGGDSGDDTDANGGRSCSVDSVYYPECLGWGENWPDGQCDIFNKENDPDCDDDPDWSDIDYDDNPNTDTDNDYTPPSNDDLFPDPEDPTKPITEDVPTDETSDTAVVKAITNLNDDVNESLNQLHADVNKNDAEMIRQLQKLNDFNQNNTAIADLHESLNVGFENNQKGLQALNDNLINGVSNMSNSLNHSLGDGFGAVNNNLTKIRKELVDINQGLDSGFGDVVDGLNELGDKIGNLGSSEITNANCGSFVCHSEDQAQCFIAQMLHRQDCDAATSNNDSAYSDLDDELSDIINDSDSQITNLTKIDLGIEDGLSYYGTNNGFSFDSGCPASRSYNVLGGDFTINYQPWCDLALYIRALLVSFSFISTIVMLVKFSG